jgi:hypothetical protein
MINTYMFNSLALDRFNCESKGENNERRKSRVCSLVHNTSKVEGRAEISRWKLR